MSTTTTTATAGDAAMQPSADRLWLIPLLVLFVAKGVLLVAIVAPFTGHDEVDHFYYIERLAAGRGLGVVGEVELPPRAEPYRRYVADYPTNAEVIQPPLYHLLMAPLLWLAPGGDVSELYTLRFVSVAAGALIVWLAYATARVVFPDDLLMRAGVPVFVAFQPQLSFEAAIVNHDIQVIALSSLLVYLLLEWLPRGYSSRRQLALGLVAGAGLWTKTSFGLLLPLIALCVVWSWRDDRGSWRDLALALLRTCGLAVAMAMPWFIRSLWLYGDPTGASRLHSLADYGEQASTYRAMVTSAVFWRGRLEDFWGNYGWRLVPFDPTIYQAIYVGWALAAVGLVVLVVRGMRARWTGRSLGLRRIQRRAIAVMVLWVLLMVFGVLYVGTIQFTQSRFAFPAMIGFAMLTVLGLGQWLPPRGRPWLVPVLVAALALLNVVVAVRFLIPFYYGADGATPLTQ